MEPHEPYDPPEPFRSRFLVDDDGKRLDDVEGPVREMVALALPGADHDDAGKPLDLVDALAKIRARGTPLTEEELAPIRRLGERSKRTNERLYDGAVASADDQVRRLFEELERRGFLDDTVVVLTADHGEEFKEHGNTSHGRTLYEESVRVPLILIGPGIPAGRRVAENVSLLDLAPTLLELLGLPAEPHFEGRSLVPLIRAGGGARREPGATPDIVLQLERSIPVEMDQRTHSRALVRGDDKLLVRLDGSTEIYALAADPGETRSGAFTLAGLEPAMIEDLSLAEARVGERAGSPVPSAPVDETLKQRLRALGYTP